MLTPDSGTSLEHTHPLIRTHESLLEATQNDRIVGKAQIPHNLLNTALFLSAAEAFCSRKYRVLHCFTQVLRNRVMELSGAPDDLRNSMTEYGSKMILTHPPTHPPHLSTQRGLVLYH